jgi:hypothetical protein
MLNENKMTQYLKKKTWMEKNTIKKDLNKKKFKVIHVHITNIFFTLTVLLIFF